MPSSATHSFFLPDFQAEPPSPLTPGSDTSTLFDFVVDSSRSPFGDSKASDLASPTETLADHDAQLEQSGASPLSRRQHYLDRIEKVLSAGFNPFDLLARSESNHSTIEAFDRKPCANGARYVDAVPKTRFDMQHFGSNAQSDPNASPNPELRPDIAQYGCFYDPSSADGYSAPSQGGLLSTAPAFASPSFSHLSTASSPAATLQPAAPSAFREIGGRPSPLSSPNLSAASPPASHHRFGSHSSEAASPAPFSHGMLSDPVLSQTMGQMGQIRLDEDQRYPPTFDDSSDHIGSPAYSQLNAAQHNDGRAPAEYPTVARASFGGQTASSTPQLTLGIPTVSVSDTSMDYTPIAPNADAAMPSITVMAPSPSTPRAVGAHGQAGGFQGILAQLAASSQGASPHINAAASQSSGTGNWLPSDSSTAIHNEPLSYSGGPGSTPDSHQPSSNQGLFRPTNASGRLVPEGYTAGSAQVMSALAGNPHRNPAVHAPGQWSSQAKRQDSYDKIRQFLRLDVDMGFQSNGKTESPTLAMFRKRANSDVGPRSPVVAGNAGGAGGAGTAFDWSFAATSQAGAKTHTEALDLDWPSFKGDSAVFTDPSMQIDLSELATMDPSLLNSSQLSIDMSKTLSENNAFLPDLQHQQLHLQQQSQYQHSHQQQQQQQHPQTMPPTFQLNDQSNALGGINFSPQLPIAGPNEFNPGWRFPGDGAQDASASGTSGAQKLRRSSSARHSSSAGHRRLTHSEDLSRSRMFQGADEDFLAQITAPNGGLAPPSAGRSVSSSNVGTGGHHHTMSGSARVHPYRTGHDRHCSFGSNTSSSSAGSQMGGGTMYDASGNLVQYPSDAFGSTTGAGMEGVAPSPSASSVASGASSQSMLAPPVPVVTSQATQAASASRRKSEALFACPIPGCGSTFTRQYNLRGHLRSHADERPYKCDWPGCDKSFARSHDCKRHQNLHLNIKPHTCEQCGKTFARLDALNRHHKSDTGGCTMKSDGESQSNSTDASSVSGAERAAWSPHGSDHSDQTWAQKSAPGGATAVESSYSNKAFGGHVL